MDRPDEGEEVPRSSALIAVATVTAAVTVYLAIRMPLAMESFRGIFTGFGVKPTLAATLVMKFPALWWVFATASVAVLLWILAVSRPKRIEHARMKLALRSVITLTAIAYVFAAIAIYTLIFKLGAVV